MDERIASDRQEEHRLPILELVLAGRLALRRAAVVGTRAARAP